MDLDELEFLWEDNDEEIIEHIIHMRTYTVKERKDYYNDLDNLEFFQRFRLKKTTLDNVINEIMPYMPNGRQQYHELSVRDQVLLTLRFYATGNFYVTVGDFGGVHKTTAGRIIKRITNILNQLAPRYIKFPTEQEQQSVQRDFYQVAQFPKVIGAIDCTHIPLQSPGGDNPETYRNRKGFFSLNVQVVCNSKHYIMDIVSRWPGSCHDSHIFSNSSIKLRFENGEFRDCILLGDSGYALSHYLMTPVLNPNTRAKELYNRAHISTRSIIERTFGIIKRRFPILTCGMRCKLLLARKSIVATAVIHNIAILSRDEVEEVVEVEGVEANLPIYNAQDGEVGNVVQQNFINYFETLL